MKWNAAEVSIQNMHVVDQTSVLLFMNALTDSAHFAFPNRFTAEGDERETLIRISADY